MQTIADVAKLQVLQVPDDQLRTNQKVRGASNSVLALARSEVLPALPKADVSVSNL